MRILFLTCKWPISYYVLTRWGEREISLISPLIKRTRWHPTPVLLPGKSHGRKSLVGCSTWGREESDMTGRLHFHALEKDMATHSSVLAWRIPGTGEPGGLPSRVAKSRTRPKWLSSSSSSSHILRALPSILNTPQRLHPKYYPTGC